MHKFRIHLYQNGFSYIDYRFKVRKAVFFLEFNNWPDITLSTQTIDRFLLTEYHIQHYAGNRNTKNEQEIILYLKSSVCNKLISVSPQKYVSHTFKRGELKLIDSLYNPQRKPHFKILIHLYRFVFHYFKRCC